MERYAVIVSYQEDHDQITEYFVSICWPIDWYAGLTVDIG